MGRMGILDSIDTRYFNTVSTYIHTGTNDDALRSLVRAAQLLFGRGPNSSTEKFSTGAYFLSHEVILWTEADKPENIKPEFLSNQNYSEYLHTLSKMRVEKPPSICRGGIKPPPPPESNNGRRSPTIFDFPITSIIPIYCIDDDAHRPSSACCQKEHNEVVPHILTKDFILFFAHLFQLDTS